MHNDELVDRFADPNNPLKIKYDDIVSASRRIVGAIRRTPCLRANMSDTLGMELYIKQESAQFTGSFKERGVINTLLLLPEDQRKLGVICASRGNHGSALSYHSKLLGIPCAVVMTVQSPITKIMKTEMHGAKTLLHGTSMAEATQHAMALSKQSNMLYISGYDHPNVIEGQGTIGIEVLEQVPDVDVIIVPVGGGSLLAGLGVAVRHLKPDTELYGVQTDKTYAMVESLRRNERTRIEVGSTIADGLAVNTVGVNTFHNIKGVVDKMVIVKEDWVCRAIMHIAEEERFIIEGAGAVPIAAIMAGLFPNLKGKKVVCVLTGGNIDTTTLTRVLERGMAIEGRLVKFKVTLSDRPGGMAELCSLLAGLGVTLRDSLPERAWVKGDVFSVEMKIIAETRGWEHTKELVAVIKKNYKEYYFPDMSDNQAKSQGTARRGPCLAPNPICMQ